MRTETDFLGSVEVKAEALFGIHAVRAKENFPNKVPFNEAWYRAAGAVKKACYLTYRKMKQATSEKIPGAALPFSWMDDAVIDALVEAASEKGGIMTISSCPASWGAPARAST